MKLILERTTKIIPIIGSLNIAEESIIFMEINPTPFLLCFADL
jgi:hypothetical protein